MPITPKTLNIIRTAVESGTVIDQRKADNAAVLKLFETLASAGTQARTIAADFERRNLPHTKILTSIALMAEVLSGQVFEIKLDIEPDDDE